MGAFFGAITTNVGGGGAAALGASINYVSPAGANVNAVPAITAAVGRVVVTLPSGSATWLSMTAGGIDGKLVDIKNADAANTLTLSQAGFPGLGVILGPGNHQLVYWDAAAGLWETTTP